MQRISSGQIATPPGPFFASLETAAGQALRHPGRAFIGDGFQHSQNTDGSVTGGSWLQSFLAGADTITGLDYLEDVTRFSVVTSIGIAMSGAARTSGDLDAIGVVGLALASTANGMNAWGGYFDGPRLVAGAGSVSGIEVNTSQRAGVSPADTGITEFGRKGLTPYKAPVSGQSTGIGIGGGSDAAVFGLTYDNDGAVNIGNNGGAFKSGVNIRFNALRREGEDDDTVSPGATGYAKAVSLAHDHGISWYSLMPSGAVGSGTQELAVRLYSTVDDAATRLAQIFSDTGVSFREQVSPGQDLFRIQNDADAGANLAAWPAATGGAPTLRAEGINANISLGLMPKGTGGLYVPVANVPAYANDAAAASGGLALGTFYFNSTVGALSQRRV